jgi:cupin fold WbuC family metalloprotein
VLQGKLAVLIFSDSGEITDTVIIDGKNVRGIDIKPGTWHSIVALESGTVIFETKDGPYVAATDKDFGSWAPDEKSPDKTAYLAKINKYLTTRCSSD